MPKTPRDLWVRLSLILIIVFSTCFSVLLPHAEAQQVLDSNSLGYEIDSALSLQLTHIIRVNNPTFERIEGGGLFVPLVRNETGHHYVIIFNITASTGLPRILRDNFGNTYAYWSNLMLDLGETFNARIDYYVLSFGTRYLIDRTSMTDYDRNLDGFEIYTQPEDLIQSDAPQIVSEANSITQNVNNTHDKVFQIYSFVTSHVQYARQEYERGALWALENGTGDCSELAYLFVALCRAVGIPARIRVGFALPSSDETTADGHMWAEYHLQNRGWIPVDPTWRLFDRIDDRHFASMNSMPEITPYANYFFNYTQGPNLSSIIHDQNILLKPSSLNLFGNELVDNTLKVVKTIDQARYAISIERLLGMPLLFSSQASQVDEAFQTSQISLQNALKELEENLQMVQSYILQAQDKSEEALHSAWMLVAYAFSIILGALMVILLATYFLAGRHQYRVAT